MEKEKHYGIFKANVEYIDSFNTAGNKPYRLSVNEFADLTNEEFKASHGTYRSFSKRVIAGYLFQVHEFHCGAFEHRLERERSC